jgi:uncharacterized protein YegP (UPF0339 family)
MRQPYFDVHFAAGWRWKLIAANGEPVAVSEPYSSEDAAIRGAQAVQRIASMATIHRSR